MTRIKVEKKEFIKVLNVASAFAGRSKALPILDCVKIKVNDNVMTVVSTDNENAISKKMEVLESDGSVTFCVNYKDFSSYIKLVSGDIVTLVVNEKEMEVKHEKGNVTLPLMDAEEFPAFKQDDNFIDFAIDSCVLNNWIVDAANFISDDMLRPQLNGVYIYRRDMEVGCCGTDGHKLFYNHFKDESTDFFEFIINKNSLSSVCNICKSTSSVRIKIGFKNTTFIGENITLLMRNVEGKYPSHKSVIRNDNNISVVVCCNEMKEAIYRCNVSAGKNNSLVKLEIKDDELVLSSQDIDYGVKAVERLSAKSDGEITIGFKSDYLLDILNTINTEKCLIKLKDESKAGIFYEYENNGISSNKLSLLMPVIV